MIGSQGFKKKFLQENEVEFHQQNEEHINVLKKIQNVANKGQKKYFKKNIIKKIREYILVLSALR